MHVAAVRAPLELDPELDLRRLATRSPRLALLVEASSTRADARGARARLLLLLLSLSCPRESAPRRRWYVPGAVVRVGPAALLRAWGRAWEKVPCVRTVRRHLAALEECCAIVREPGERIPQLRAPGRAPRFPDTIHVLDHEEDARWWEVEGAELLRRHPELRTSPEAWRARLSGWRQLARTRQLPLFEAPAAPRALPGHERPPETLPAARVAARLVARGLRLGGLELLEALRVSGAHLPNRAQLEALERPSRFARAAALYALALGRGDRIRDGWAWIRSALRRASSEEGARALRRLGIDHGGDSGSESPPRCTGGAGAGLDRPAVGSRGVFP